MVRDQPWLSPPLALAGWVSLVMGGLVLAQQSSGVMTPLTKYCALIYLAILVLIALAWLDRRLRGPGRICPKCRGKGRSKPSGGCPSCWTRYEVYDLWSSRPPKSGPVGPAQREPGFPLEWPSVDQTTCGNLLGRKRRRDGSLLSALVGRRKSWPGGGRSLEAPELSEFGDETTQERLLRGKRWREFGRVTGAERPAPPRS